MHSSASKQAHIKHMLLYTLGKPVMADPTCLTCIFVHV